MSNAPQLEVQKLWLVTRNGQADKIDTFRRGLNMIYGSGGTGKSTSLRLIMYVLGGKYPNLPPEVSNNYETVAVQFVVQGKVLSVQRNLHSDSKPIAVYFGDIKRIGSKPDVECHRAGTTSLASATATFFEILGIPNLKVPVAPSNPDGRLTTVSIKDVLKSIYLDDDVIGTSAFLGNGNVFKHHKHIESIKALLKIDTSAIQEIGAKLQEISDNKKSLEQSIKIVASFLQKNNISKDKLESELSKVTSRISDLKKEEEKISGSISQKSDKTREMSDKILSKKELISESEEELSIVKLKIDEFNDLLKAYNDEIEEKEAIREYPALINENGAHCPTCHSEISSEEALDISELSRKILELKRKREDLAFVIERLSKTAESIRNEIESQISELKSLEEELSIKQNSAISPLLEQRDEMMFELGKQIERQSAIEKNMRVVDSHEADSIELKMVEKNETEVKLAMEKLKKEARQSEDVASKVSEYFKEFIEYVELPSVENPRVGTDFIPYITSDGSEIKYYQVSSVSMKAVLCVGYLTAIMKYALSEGAYLPSLLMIDSPSRGRSNNTQNPVEQIDTKVLDKIYSYWLHLTNKFNQLQIIVVDSKEPTDELARNRIIQIFDKSGKVSDRKGLAVSRSKSIPSNGIDVREDSSEPTTA